MGSAEKCAEQLRIGDKGQEVSWILGVASKQLRLLHGRVGTIPLW